jgi:UDP-2-acetamido-2-deoxy-ribo-hexuluronate aminotransferase
MGGRLDALQAAILNVKIKYYENDVLRRQNVAEQYTEQLTGSNLILPKISEHKTSVWAQYSIRVPNRDKVQELLKEKGIPTAVHYPKPLHLQECFQYLGYKKGDYPKSEKIANEIMSLPMNPYLSSEEVKYVANQVKAINLIEVVS